MGGADRNGWCVPIHQRRLRRMGAARYGLYDFGQAVFLSLLGSAKVPEKRPICICNMDHRVDNIIWSIVNLTRSVDTWSSSHKERSWLPKRKI
jgi:hypothetical protein